jgi:hypothetical protein
MASDRTSASGPAAVETSSLLTEKGFVHGFTTRAGTVKDAGVDERALYLVSQVHGSTVLRANGPPGEFRKQEADAIVLEPGQAGAVRVADCVPILVGDSVSGRAATIHAGWRGVASGVVPAAIAQLRGHPADLTAAIGPCIEACCFEVGKEVANQLAFAVPSPGVLVRAEGGKVWIDLVAAVRAQLEACGIPPHQIERVGACTKHHGDRYHSFRRDGATSGRMLGVIQARSPRSPRAPYVAA